MFISGEVALAPYPEWAQGDAALASISELMRRFHDASSEFDPTGWSWSEEMADRAVAVSCVTTTRAWKTSSFATVLRSRSSTSISRRRDGPSTTLLRARRMCVPIDDDQSARRLGWDQPIWSRDFASSRMRTASRLRTGWSSLAWLADSIARGGEFLMRQIEAGDSNFTALWNEIGGMPRFDRRREWWEEHHDRFLAALT